VTIKTNGNAAQMIRMITSSIVSTIATMLLVFTFGTNAIEKMIDSKVEAKVAPLATEIIGSRAMLEKNIRDFDAWRIQRTSDAVFTSATLGEILARLDELRIRQVRIEVRLDALCDGKSTR
jgi:hypothetical protein